MTWITVKQFPVNEGYVSAMWFFNPQVGVIGFHWNVSTTTNGCVKWTTDGGVTWTNSTVPSLNNTSPQITDIWFSDSLRGWLTVSGNLNVGDPCLWRTTDGGKSWNPNPKNPTMAFGHLACVRQTDTALIVTGDLGVGLWVSTDSGASWMQHQTLRNNGLAFRGHNVVATEFGQKSTTTFLTSSDGGITWVNSVLGFQHEGWGVHHMRNSTTFVAAPEDTTVAGVSQRSYVYRSDDYGRDWSRLTQLPINTTGDVEGVEDLLFVQNSGGIANSPQGLLESTDGGTNWTPIGGPNQGGADPYRKCDTRFAVTGCGNIIYAADGAAGLWKTVNAPGLTITNKDSLRPMTAMLCDTTKQLYYLHNANSSSVVIQDIRIFDTLRRPFKTHALWVDSLPSDFMSIQVGDSVAFRLAWHPGAMMDSAASDSATVRIIFYATYLVPCVSTPALAYDTVFLRVKLFGTTVPAEYAVAPRNIKTDTLFTCISVDTTITVINSGCDSITLTTASLTKGTWSITNAAGTALKLPMRVGSGDTIVLRLHAKPTSSSTLFDSLKVVMHYMGRDTSFGVALRTSAKLGIALATQASLGFDSLAICDSLDKIIPLTNRGCDTLKITKADMSDGHFVLLDTNGKPLTLPIIIPGDSVRRVLVRFIPQQLGDKSGALNVHYHYFGFDSTNSIPLTGIGASSGALVYSKSVDFHDVPVCKPGYVDTTIEFANTTCAESILVDSLVLPPGFTLIDPAQLPKQLLAGQRLTLKIRYQPTGKQADQGKALLKAALHNGTQVVYDTIAFSGVGVAGPSSFTITPTIQANTFDFGTRTSCDHADSVTLAIYNPGCDTTIISSVSLDGNLSGAFQAHTDRTIPAKLAPVSTSGDTMHVTVAITSLSPNTYTGNLHIRYTLSDGSTHDSLAPVALTVATGGGTQSLYMSTGSHLDLDTIRACSARDTMIDITNTGCGTDTVVCTISGVGFLTADTTIITPGATAHIHVRYDGLSRGDVQSLIHITTGKGVTHNLVDVTVTGYVPPTDSVHFSIKLDKSSITAGTFFRAYLSPDKTFTGSGLDSIYGIFVYPANEFVVGSGALSTSAGLALVKNGPESISGGIGHYPFEVTKTGGISLDPATPVVTFALEAVVSDSFGGRISVDSLTFNRQDPTFSVCTLAPSSLGLTTPVLVQCGDSALMHALRGTSIVSSAPLRPNPVTSETGYKSELDLLAAEDGEAEITLFNALGELVSRDALTLKHGEKLPYTFDLHAMPAGSYYFSVSFAGTATNGTLRGTMLLLK